MIDWYDQYGRKVFLLAIVEDNHDRCREVVAADLVAWLEAADDYDRAEVRDAFDWMPVDDTGEPTTTEREEPAE